MSKQQRIFFLAFATLALAGIVLAQTAAKAPDLTGVWTTYRPPAGQAQGRGGGAPGAAPASRSCLCVLRRGRRSRSISVWSLGPEIRQVAIVSAPACRDR